MLQRFVSGKSKRFVRILSFRLCGECWAVVAWIHGQMFELLARYS